MSNFSSTNTLIVVAKFKDRSGRCKASLKEPSAKKEIHQNRLCGGGSRIFDSEGRFFFPNTKGGGAAELGVIVERCCHQMAISSLSDGRRRTAAAAAAGSSGSGVRWLMGTVAICFRVVRNSAGSLVPVACIYVVDSSLRSPRWWALLGKLRARRRKMLVLGPILRVIWRGNGKMDEVGSAWTCALVVNGTARPAVPSLPSGSSEGSFCCSFTLWVGDSVLEWEKGKDH